MSIDRVDDEQRREKARLIEDAISQSESGSWADAVATNQAILDIEPDDVLALNRLGRALTKQGRLREALDAYDRARQADPANAIALRNTARLNAILNEMDADTVDTVDSSELRPDHFIMETGRSAVLALDNLAEIHTLATVLPGDLLELRPDGPYLRLFTRSGAAVGTVPAERAHRLIELMSAGNEYTAVVVNSSVEGVRVLIRESFRSPQTRGKLAFPAIVRQAPESRAASRVGEAAVVEDEFAAEPDIDDEDVEEPEVTSTEALAEQDEVDDTEE
ncbi:MAG: tetratricopeptide repeat protein [Chloroflexota bacterium]|nr:tetratricopeptide repeat protein [Chloroflexota bacterium]